MFIRLLFFVLFIFCLKIFAIENTIIFSEIAWMGSTNSANDEWIELANLSSDNINLSGFTIQAKDGSPNIKLKGIIKSNSYFLLERTDDNSVSGVLADQFYQGSLSNSGEILYLMNSSGEIIDEVDGWNLIGSNLKKETMERNRDLTWSNGKINGNPQNSNSKLIFDDNISTGIIISNSGVINEGSGELLILTGVITDNVINFTGNINTGLLIIISNTGNILKEDILKANSGVIDVKEKNISDNIIQKINNPPVAIITLQGNKKTTGTGMLSVNVTGEDSYDIDKDKILFFWDFGDSTANFTGSNPPSHKYGTGYFKIKLKVTDKNGLYSESYLDIKVFEFPKKISEINSNKILPNTLINSKLPDVPNIKTSEGSEFGIKNIEKLKEAKRDLGVIQTQNKKSNSGSIKNIDAKTKINYYKSLITGSTKSKKSNTKKIDKITTKKPEVNNSKKVKRNDLIYEIDSKINEENNNFMTGIIEDVTGDTIFLEGGISFKKPSGNELIDDIKFVKGSILGIGENGDLKSIDTKVVEDKEDLSIIDRIVNMIYKFINWFTFVFK